MIFQGYFNLAYTVKELSLKQAEIIFAQQLEDDPESNQSIEQLLNESYSYRSNLDLSKVDKTL